jgi:C-methyltransferase-like protein/putative zinc binding protein/methyltransferase family protein
MADGLSETLRTCRICDSAVVDRILDLGAQPPANSLRRDRANRLPAIPLVLCRCRSCGTIQLTETVSPEYLFRNYVWVTGTSQAARDHSAVFCEQLVARCRGGPRFVLEVASNDGTFLQRFRERGDRVLGVDPAQNVAEMARKEGIPTRAEFFGLAVAREIVAEHGPADAVYARNVISHVANAKDVVAGMSHCMSDTGTGAIEFHCAEAILDGWQYDSIYHEHLFYHSLHSIGALIGQFGLKPFDVTDSPISGGSLVVYFSKEERAPTPAYAQMLARERARGIGEERPWREFARRCEHHRAALVDLVEARKRAGKRLIGYGASARSSTLLNFCGIDHRHLDVVVDRSPLKHDRYTPGTDIRIAAPADGFTPQPDSVLLLAWNFRDEIIGQIRAEQGWRGEIIVPLPGEPTTLTIG